MLYLYDYIYGIMQKKENLGALGCALVTKLGEGPREGARSNCLPSDMEVV